MRRLPPAVVLLAVALLAVVLPTLTGCGAAPAPTPVPSPSATAAAVSATASPSPSPVDLTLAFAGDVHFTGRTAALLRDPATAFGPIVPTLTGADLTVVNLETAITTRGTPEPKTFHFRTDTRALAALRAAGIDGVSLANNHTLDYGQTGLADTLDAVRADGFPAFGAGRTAAEAYAPWITTVKGVRIAVLGFSQVRELERTWSAQDDRPGIAMARDTARVTAAVAAARAQADLVIVFNHWGAEGDSCPSADQKTFAGALAAAGADIVVGAHAHTLQGAGWIGATYVAYGLGNFLWYGPSRSTQTGVLKLTVRGRSVTGYELVPALVSGTGQPTPLSGDAARQAQARFAGLRECAGLAAQRP